MLFLRRARDQKKRRLWRREWEWNLEILECFEHALHCHWLSHVTTTSSQLSEHSCYLPIGQKESHSSELNLRSDDECFTFLLSRWNKKLTERKKNSLYKLKMIDVKLFLSTVYIVKLQWYFYKEKKIESKKLEEVFSPEVTGFRGWIPLISQNVNQLSW